MRLPWLPLIFFLIVSILTDVYIYRCLRDRLKNRLWSRVQRCSAIVLYLLLLVAVCLPRRSGDNGMLLCVMWMLFAFISVYVGKYLFVVFDLLASIPCLVKRKRIKSITWLGAVAGVAVFAIMWWGALIERFNIDVNEVEIVRTDVPEGFDGYRIVQISDLHTGTYGDDTTFVSTLVDRINALAPDLIVFTGDIVNSRSNEINPHIAPLSRLRARDGVYSIMGNHDYGDYASWTSKDEKDKSVRYLKQVQSDMGWHMLNNETEMLHNGTDSLALIGVENIGDAPFPIYGSLLKAYPSLNDSVFKVLLTHNPAHWTDSISGHDINVPLTLSGHTHAMQMKVAGHSPAVYRYKTWGGLYADNDSTHLLYVNIGAGTVGFPARIGATPEITVLTLRKK